MKAVIFDLDGTLLNTLSDITKSMNHVLEDYGFETLDEHTVMHHLGHGFEYFIQSSLPEGEEALFEEALMKFKYYYDQFYMDDTKVYDGIVEMLKRLHDQGIQLAVFSNKQEPYVIALIRKLFPEIPFMEIRGSKEGYPKKPYPDVANEIVEHSGFPKEEFVYVGDSGTDVKTALAAQIPFVGVTWGYRSAEVIRAAGAEVLVDSPSQLCAELLKRA